MTNTHLQAPDEEGSGAGESKKTTSSSSGSATAEEKDGEQKPRRRKKKKKEQNDTPPQNGQKRELPICWFSKNMGATPATYRQARHLLLINPDWKITKGVREDARRARKLKGTDKRLKAHLVNGFNQFHLLTGRIPTDDELLAIVANPTAAFDYVYTEAKYRAKKKAVKAKKKAAKKKAPAKRKKKKS